MNSEERDAIRLSHCIVRVACNALGIVRPEEVPTDADLDEHFAHCGRRWEELGAMDPDQPSVMLERKMLSTPWPTPVCLDRLREYRAIYGELEYAKIKTWWERRQAGAELEDYLRAQRNTPRQ